MIGKPLYTTMRGSCLCTHNDPLVLDCDGGHFDFCAANQACYLDRGPGRFGIWHELDVDVVHFLTSLRSVTVDGDGDDVSHLEAGVLNDLLHSGDGVCGLQGNVGPGDLPWLSATVVSTYSPNGLV